jgi:hypothetical protein
MNGATEPLMSAFTRARTVTPTPGGREGGGSNSISRNKRTPLVFLAATESGARSFVCSPARRSHISLPPSSIRSPPAPPSAADTQSDSSSRPGDFSIDLAPLRNM